MWTSASLCASAEFPQSYSNRKSCSNRTIGRGWIMIMKVDAQDPGASSGKDQRHPTVGSNLLGLLTLRLRWAARSEDQLNSIWSLQSLVCKGREGEVGRFTVPHIADLQTKQNGAATYFAEQQNLARIVSELFVQLHVSLSRQRAPMWWCWNPMWGNVNNLSPHLSRAHSYRNIPALRNILHSLTLHCLPQYRRTPHLDCFSIFLVEMISSDLVFGR